MDSGSGDQHVIKVLWNGLVKQGKETSDVPLVVFTSKLH